MNENVIYYIKEERTRGGYDMLDVLLISFTITDRKSKGLARNLNFAVPLSF